MKFYICAQNAHHKNVESIHKMMKKNNVEYTMQNDLSNIDETYNVALCLTTFYPPEMFPTQCKVVYGPHFFVFPTDALHPLHSHTFDPSRFFYNALTEWNVTIHRSFAKNIEFIACPFGLDIENIQQVPPVEQRTKVMVYFKARHNDCLETALNFIKSKNESIILLKYGHYTDNDFKQQLKDTKFVIWLGSHESQGFAFQEIQASNVPILVWDIRSTYDEYNNGWPHESYRKYGLPLLATSANCWSDECGIKFTNVSELPDAYEQITKKLSTFTPRKFVESKLSLTITYNNLLKRIGLGTIDC